MDSDRLRALLAAVQAGEISPDEALQRLRRLPFENLGFARLDTHRAIRAGAPEAVYCEGKRPAEIVRILSRLIQDHRNVLATRASPAIRDAACAAGVPVAYHEVPRLLVANPEPVGSVGLIAVVSAGTSDQPVAEEVAVTAEVRGNRVERIYDAGVAGLHRLLEQHPLLLEANAIVVVAGMEGALPSVVGGLVDRPVIAVPTSVGYGVSLGGFAALLAMLASCVPGVAVVNIDNGFGAACLADRINKLAVKIR
ncbi:MAG: nickel pincer cofactor biosynthesis protein LarB [Candidatus Rokubacteria bacterium]|nr:nickel pincer cofactor biosynthesis protein LarB [Candidatus Rokubacteria bacterium]